MLVLAALLRGPEWVYLPIGDEANHYLNMMSVQESFLRGEDCWQRLCPLLAWTDTHAYPPVGYLVPGLLGAMAGGVSLSALPAQQVPWMVLIVFSTYFLGRRIFEGKDGVGRRVGLLSAFLVAFAPTLVGYLSAALLDLASTATTLLALLALAWYQDARDPLSGCAMGAAVAVAFLTKWTAILVLAPALVMVYCRQLGSRPRREGLGLLAFLVMGLVIPVLLLHFQRPILDQYLGWPLPRSILIVLVNLEGVAGIAWLLAVRSGAGPTRNLVLAAAIALLMVVPFLAWNQDALERRFSRHTDDKVTARAMIYGPTIMPLPYLWGEPGNLAEFAVAVLALLWLALRGPRGSLALLVGPLLAIALMSTDPALTLDYRYKLPAVPVLILAVVGWLQGQRLTRATSTILFLGLALYSMGLWLSGDVVPCQPTHQVRPGDLGSSPSSLGGQVARLVDAVARHTGPDPEAVWTVIRSPLLFPYTGHSDSSPGTSGNVPIRRTFHDSIQIVALTRGHALVIRGVLETGGLRDTPADLSVTRILALRRPDVSLQHLHHLATNGADRIRQSWVLVLSPPGPLQPDLQLPGTLGRPHPLPAVEGLEARLYPFTAQHPFRPNPAQTTPGSTTGATGPSGNPP